MKGFLRDLKVALQIGGNNSNFGGVDGCSLFPIWLLELGNGIVRKGKALHATQGNSMEVTGNE